ncbi:hypothetical protein KL933_002547 [Ogataea haglerorum]|uniref:Monopolin complex subunit Csm1/Pcs1 C-terminal domain-containing protein n=1 Tax=Ogataea haglerorum TaxID=1937702 RepID=A0AAN6D5S3_9ASCO|nr:hypothetical protein KL933_002547 [Ogataea haglerorum]KAG7731111.1 hypothetical protein KL948_003391 [Ogataea haglerorum]
MPKKRTTKRAEQPNKRTTRAKTLKGDENEVGKSVFEAEVNDNDNVDGMGNPSAIHDQKENQEPQSEGSKNPGDKKPLSPIPGLENPLITPSKRLFDSPERPTLLSPTKARQEFRLPSEAAVSQLVQRKDLKTLTSILNDLTTSKTEKMFQDYKKLSERKHQTSETLINNLTKENQKLRLSIKSLQASKQNSKETDSLRRQIETLKRENTRLSSEIESLSAKRGSNQSEIDNAVAELDLMGTKLEITELLTGLTCQEYIEDAENMIFKMKQQGETCFLIYQLLISKTGAGEIVYIPIFKQEESQSGSERNEWMENVKKLEKVLPDYLLDNLTFPANTLYNFYNKLGRSLNKKVE